MTTSAAARRPDSSGRATRDGVSLAWAAYGDGGTPLVLLPTWEIIDSRFWKLQVGYLARHQRVVTYDGRGTGASDRPLGAAAYSHPECAADVLAVMDAAGVERAVLVGLSMGATWALTAAAEHPDRILGVVVIGPSCQFAETEDESARARESFARRRETASGWSKYNQHWIAGQFDDFREFFFGEMFAEGHSSKQREDALAWSGDQSGPLLAAITAGRLGLEGGVAATPIEDVCARIQCPVLVIHGDEDRIQPWSQGQRIADLTGGELLLMVGCGHGPLARDPVRVNLAIGEFVRGVGGRDISPADR